MSTASSLPLLPDELLQRTISLAFVSSPSATSATTPSLFIPRGLVNVSNRCYLSSVFQCLLATRPFASYLHQCIDSTSLSTLRPCLATVSEVSATYAELLGFVAEYQQAEQVVAVRANASLTPSAGLPRTASPAPAATNINGATSQLAHAQQSAHSAATSAPLASSSTSQASSSSSPSALVAPRPVVASTSSSSLSDMQSDHTVSPSPVVAVAGEDEEWNVSQNKAAKRANKKSAKLNQPAPRAQPQRTPSPQPTQNNGNNQHPQQNGHTTVTTAASTEVDPVEEVAAYIASTQLNGHGEEAEREMREEVEDVAAGQGGSTSSNRRRRRKKAQQAAAASTVSGSSTNSSAPNAKPAASVASIAQSSPHSLLSQASAALNAAFTSAPPTPAAPTGTSTSATTVLQHASTHPPFAPSFPQLLSSFQKEQVGRQEDAAEFLLFLLDKLQEESIHIQQQLSSHTAVDGSRSEAAADDWTEIGKGSKQLIMRKSTVLSVTPVSSLCSFRLRSCLHIPMRHKDSISFQPAYLLPLDLPAATTQPQQRTQPFRIEDAIDRFMSVSTLDDHRRKGASQSHSIDGQQLPACLLLHVKRFSATLHKLSAHVVFGEVLVLPSGVLQGWSGGSGGVRYRLCGVLVHHGATVASGHYTAFVRYRGADCSEGAAECWVSIDDSRVSVVSASTVFAQQAYILFYSRI